MKYIYCPMCGHKLTEKIIGDEGLVPYCDPCNRPYFDNPASCVEVLVMNERNQVLLLKQNYISEHRWGVVSGYVKKGDTLEETVQREVLEETGQHVERMRYVGSYYFQPKEIVMVGYIAFVTARPLGHSNEVDDIMWCDVCEVNKFINRENNLSGIHFDASMALLNL
jgi:NAD+ diphosphatase